MIPRSDRPTSWNVGVLGMALAIGWGATAAGQSPIEPQTRSGLLSRFIPIRPHLPPDPRRDLFYTTRWANGPADNTHPNNPCDGGLYGRRWPGSCTQCEAPYFRGDPGCSTLGPKCEPGHKAGRLIGNYFHPFKPVGSYYSGGCYVPIYDLDPAVPGPGPFPWNHLCRQPLGG